jgi:hypothetical protein
MLFAGKTAKIISEAFLKRTRLRNKKTEKTSFFH